MTTEAQNFLTETKTVTETTAMTNSMINSTDLKLEVVRLDSNLTNTTESRVCYLFLGFLLFATMATLVVAFRYRRKYRRYRHNFITISRRLADPNEKSRHRNTQTVEDAYTNPNCQAAKTEVHDHPLRREVEPLYVNSILPPVETDRYMSNEGLIYISLGSSLDMMTQGRPKKIRTKKGKISYSAIDYDKSGKVTIVSKVDNEDENENKIYQNCPPIVRRII
ncbi:unnamed protein product [Lymnaea stagnalis]|uniref:Uncharacterized protein n=1 Tax=Lymnaea stagnalis TaxID=6523 RepID=A0AAV2HLJ5_LYMST